LKQLSCPAVLQRPMKKLLSLLLFVFLISVSCVYGETYTLTYYAGAGGSIDGPTPQTVEYGFDGTHVTAVADLGYHFITWSDLGENNPRTELYVTSDITVTAIFAINTYTLTYYAGAGGSITGTTPQTVEYGSDGTTVEAVPNECYQFVDWSDTSVQNPRTDWYVTEDITVTANFAAVCGTYSAPTDSFTSGLAVNGSVNGSLSNGSSYTSNQNVTFSNVTSSRKYFMTQANFSGGNVDFTNLKIDTSNGKIAVDTTGVTGFYGTHTLWLTKTGSSGVYVCPNATSVSEVSGSCSGILSFAGPFPQTKSGVTVSVDGSYWKVEGLIGSGAGEKGPVQSGTISASVTGTAVLAMQISELDFGTINVNQTKNATTALTSAFRLRNDGNVNINITVNATQLWNRENSTSAKYKFMCTTLLGKDCPSGSQTNWTQMPISSAAVSVVANMTWNETSDVFADVDIEITAPTDEPAGGRSSTVYFTAAQA